MCMGAGVHAPSEKRGPCGILCERVLVSALLVSGVGGVHFDVLLLFIQISYELQGVKE